ncbi:MAG: metallophosphoesterase family protein [Candidatus Margulisbacteria bacterium]|nr:metallophosphoesterase family protein [Candidatus Margulisiibacteriota bacterium]
MKRIITALLILLAALAITGCEEAVIIPTDQFQKRPYLLYTNDNTSMTVAWQTTGQTQHAYIDWGSSTTYTNRSVVWGDSANLYTFTIEGLTPQSRTYYQVTVANESATGSFMTAPLAAATNLTFYAYGDNRDGPIAQDGLLARLLIDMRALPDDRQTFCLHGGDLTFYGLDENQWDEYFFNREYTSTLDFLAQFPVMIALGNHEGYSASYLHEDQPGLLARKYWPYPYYAETGESYYSFDYGPAHFTVIDQYSNNKSYTIESSAQYNWIEADLLATAKPWKFVVFHEPAWTASTQEGYHGNNTTIQQELCPVFAQNGVQVVIQGHQHFYARVSPPDGRQYLTLGGGGAALNPPDANAAYLAASAQAFHFARFDIEGDVLTVSVLDENGALLDQFSVSK